MFLEYLKIVYLDRLAASQIIICKFITCLSQKLTYVTQRFHVSIFQCSLERMVWTEMKKENNFK